jgi:excinuclease ABC subunit B
MRLEMFAAAENLDFEKAARLRDELKRAEAAAGSDGKGAALEQNGFDPYAASAKRKSAVRAPAKAGGRGARNGRRYKTR